jgi:hypothetical protein
VMVSVLLVKKKVHPPLSTFPMGDTESEVISTPGQPFWALLARLSRCERRSFPLLPPRIQQEVCCIAERGRGKGRGGGGPMAELRRLTPHWQRGVAEPFSPPPFFSSSSLKQPLHRLPDDISSALLFCPPPFFFSSYFTIPHITLMELPFTSPIPQNTQSKRLQFSKKKSRISRKSATFVPGNATVPLSLFFSFFSFLSHSVHYRQW